MCIFSIDYIHSGNAIAFTDYHNYPIVHKVIDTESTSRSQFKKQLYFVYLPMTTTVISHIGITMQNGKL